MAHPKGRGPPWAAPASAGFWDGNWNPIDLGLPWLLRGPLAQLSSPWLQGDTFPKHSCLSAGGDCSFGNLLRAASTILGSGELELGGSLTIKQEHPWSSPPKKTLPAHPKAPPASSTRHQRHEGVSRTRCLRASRGPWQGTELSPRAR